jgi:hypothetical protein
MFSSEASSSTEAKEQEQDLEEIQNKKKSANVTMRAFQLYYVASTNHKEEPGTVNYVGESYWCQKFYETTFKLIYNPVKKVYVALPILVSQGVTRFPYNYADRESEEFVCRKTGGMLPGSAPWAPSASVTIKYADTGQEYSIENDVFAGPLKREAEQAGYQFMELRGGSAAIIGMFDIGVKNGLFGPFEEEEAAAEDGSSTIKKSIIPVEPYYNVVPRPFTREVKMLDDGANSQLIIQGLQPANKEELSGGDIIPTEKQLEVLKEIKRLQAWLEAEKKREGGGGGFNQKTASSSSSDYFKSGQFQSDQDYLKMQQDYLNKIEELEKQMKINREQDKIEMTDHHNNFVNAIYYAASSAATAAAGASVPEQQQQPAGFLYNAETVVEEESKHLFDKWPIFGGGSSRSRANDNNNNSIDDDNDDSKSNSRRRNSSSTRNLDHLK